MNKNKHGYTTTEQQTHEIEVLGWTYSVYVDVKLFVKPSDYTCTDSDLDHDGYVEVQDIKITNIFIDNGTGVEKQLQYSQLSKRVQKEINAALDVLVLE